jgi:hypothetical protein
MEGKCGANRENRPAKSSQGESEATRWRKGRDDTVHFIPAGLESVRTGNVQVQGVVVVAHDVPGGPAVRSGSMMALPPRRIRLARDARHDGAGHTKHGKQSSPMAGY